MKRKIPPTRQELFRLRRRLEIALRGHKLLKDKLEALIKEITPLLPRYRSLVEEVERRFPAVVGRFAMADAASPAGAVDAAVSQNVAPADLTFRERWFMGATIPEAEPPAQFGAFSYSLVRTAPELDAAVRDMRELLPALVELAVLEQTLLRIAVELERTRRRTNALEHVLIPELASARKDIEFKLSELERSDTTRLMKIKEMLEAEDEDEEARRLPAL